MMGRKMKFPSFKDLKGRTLTVSEARPRTDRPRTGGGGRGRF